MGKSIEEVSEDLDRILKLAEGLNFREEKKMNSSGNLELDSRRDTAEALQKLTNTDLNELKEKNRSLSRSGSRVVDLLLSELEDFFKGKSDGVSAVAMERAQITLVAAEQQYLNAQMALMSGREDVDGMMSGLADEAKRTIEVVSFLTEHIVSHRLEERYIERDGLVQEKSGLQKEEKAEAQRR